MAPTSPTPGLPSQLRNLFARGEYDTLLIRTENLHKRKRVEDEATKQLVDIVRAQSLIQLGRAEEALPLLSNIPTTASKPMLNAKKYAQVYTSWAANQDVESASQDAASLTGEDARRLEAQLQYRCGRYDKAANIYLASYQTAKTKLEEKKKPATTSRWRLMSREPTAQPITTAELEHYQTAVTEVATNTMAAFILADRAGEAIALSSDLPKTHEIEYNTACAHIQHKRFTQADVGLQGAEALLRSEMDEDDEDVEEALAPVFVQKAYLRHVAGEVAEAKQAYVEIVTGGHADAASQAVAANNLTVALGQLAFGRSAPVQGQRTMLPKEEHDALVEGLKKMRATSGKNVERKLTANQRRAMARNRAILLVQMGRLDPCRSELAKLKSEFPGDTVVPLIEATLIARQSGLETADKVLKLAGDSLQVLAARVQLAVSCGERQRAADLLRELFSGRPAAMVTAAGLLEGVGKVDEALGLLEDLVAKCTPGQVAGVKKVLAEMLLRVKKYEQAASVLREVVQADRHDSTAIAQLVVATSYFDAREAEEVALKMPPMLDAKEIDAKLLEGLPPPKRKQVAALKNSENGGEVKLEERDAAARAQAARERKKKKRKKRLPKDFDPDGPPPDPERWLPKTLRSGYRKKKTRNEIHFKGSQGADAAAADAAAVKNAEKVAAKATGLGNESISGPGGRARVQRKKKNRR